MKMKERLMSKVFWMELVLIVAQVLKVFGIYEMPTEMISTIQDIITIIFTIFATLNDPTNKTGF